MDIKRLMKCGHIGYGETTDGKPYCIICDCDKLDDNPLDLTNREAKCPHCGKIRQSSYDLPFFQPKELFYPNGKYDSFECGCAGWD